MEAICFDDVDFEKDELQNFLTSITHLKSLSLTRIRNINLNLDSLPCIPSLSEINLTYTSAHNVGYLALVGKNLERVAGISFTDSELQTLLQTAPKLKYLSSAFSRAQIELILQYGRLRQIKTESSFLKMPILHNLEEFSSENITFNMLRHLVEAHPHLKSLHCGRITFSHPMQQSDFEFLKASSIRFFEPNVSLKKPEDINNLLYLAKALPHVPDLLIYSAENIVIEQLFHPKKNILPDHCKHVSMRFMDAVENASYAINLHFFQKAETLDFYFIENIVFDPTDMPFLPNLKKIKINNLIHCAIENLEPFLFECIAKAPHLEEIVINLRVPPNTQPPFSSPEASAQLAQLVAARKLSVTIKIDDKPVIVSSLSPNLNLARTAIGRSEGIASSANAAQDLPGTSSTTNLHQEKEFFKTGSDNPTLKAKRYFPGIEPNLYRLWIWQPDLNSLEKTYTQPNDFTRVALPIAAPAPSGSQLEQGGLSVIAQNGREIILPSLSPQESIAELRIIDIKTGQPISGFRLERSAKTGFHRVALPEPGDYKIEFTVALPNQTPALPDELKRVQDDYNAFTPEDTPVPNFSSLKAAAQYYRDHKTGRCELRALAAYSELLERGYSTDNVKIITNSVHAYLEVQQDGHWHPLDLGGYPATVQEEPAVSANSKPATPVSPQSDSSPPVALQERIESLKQVLPIDARDLTFYSVHNPTALQAFYSAKLTRYSAQNIFVAQKPSDLSDAGPGMNENGEIVPNYTSFKRWLDAQRSLSAPPLILIDIRGWGPEETAQLNDLLDRKLRQPSDWPDIQLIGDPNRPYEAYGPDFKRRVQKGVHLNTPAAPLLAALPLEDKEAKAPSQIIEIDLFQSPFYKRFLIGEWRMQAEPDNADKLVMRWQDGELLKLIKGSGSSINIVIKNAPVHDPEFQAFWTRLTTLRTIERADKVTELPKSISFYGGATGYDWDALSTGVALEPVIESDWTTLPCLSDASLLSFIENPAYQFSPEGKLVCSEAFLTRAQREGKPLRVLCVPGLSESALAQFLTHANCLNVRVIFATPAGALPEQSALKRLNVRQTPKTETILLPSNVVWELQEDVYLRTRQLQANSSGCTTVLDAASLLSAELGRFPSFTKEDKRLFLEQSQLSLNAALSDVLKKLQTGETVVLTGPIPPTLYEPITKLSLGTIEGARFPGKLIIVANPKEKTLIETWAGQRVAIQAPDKEAKKRYLDSLNERMRSNFEEFQRQMLVSNPQLQALTWEMPRELASSDKNLAALEQVLHQTLDARKAELRQRQAIASHQSRQNLPDERRATALDYTRLKKIKEGFALSPWVMMEGKTGIGKTHFIQNVLSTQMRVCHTLEEWLNAEPQNQHPIVLAVDEANFDSQLSNQGQNFLDRFKTLKGTPPGFLWQGKYYKLTDKHRALFAFNPGSYGAGRTEPSLLKDHKVSVSFSRLPDFYIRANVLKPLQTALFKPALTPESAAAITRPVLEMYQWLVERSGDDALITPRELKAMMHLIASKVNRETLTDSRVLSNLAMEAAYLIGRQTVLDKPSLLKEFDRNFEWKNSTLARVIPPELGDLAESQYRAKEYGLIQEILHAKDNLLSPQNPDLGLGGLILEGGSGIGKSYFVQEVAKRYQDTGKLVVRIDAHMSFVEKERLLRKAFNEGALVLAEEFNTSFWSNKLLNNFLMGLDAEGKPAQKPGFFLLATQNPPAFEGRSELDPALRRRIMKLSLSDWPRYTPKPGPQQSLTSAEYPQPSASLLYSRITLKATSHGALTSPASESPQTPRRS